MSSPNTRTIAEEFFAAWTTGDFDTARHLLHDDVSFQGPIDAFDNAEAYLAALRGLSQIVKGAEQQHVFVDGDDVCVIYDLIILRCPPLRGHVRAARRELNAGSLHRNWGADARSRVVAGRICVGTVEDPTRWSG